jgi:hypothetical protein
MFLNQITGTGITILLIEKKWGLGHVEMLRTAQNPLKTGLQALSASGWPSYIIPLGNGFNGR